MSAAKPTRQILEEALVRDPDDLATHAAYADLLQEEGDPRGEFVRVQLALEDESKPPDEREQLQRREKELLDRHGRDWLGGLGEFLIGQRDVPEWARQRGAVYRVRFARGWPDDIDVPNLTFDAARALAAADGLRLLRRLTIGETGYTDLADLNPEQRAALEGVETGENGIDFAPLLRARQLGNVRVFRLGVEVDEEDEMYNCRTVGTGVATLLRAMPRLEELYLLAHDTDPAAVFALPLPRLRVFQFYHEGGVLPLERLAANPSLTRLEVLKVHPGHSFHFEGSYLPLDRVHPLLHSPHLPALAHLQLRAADLGCTGAGELARSGLLGRLKSLDLRYGTIGDIGARILAACPDLRRLETLDLRNNWLSDAGTDELRRALAGSPVRLEVGGQNEPGSSDYLYSGDAE